jgi:hypothetical protein
VSKEKDFKDSRARADKSRLSPTLPRPVVTFDPTSTLEIYVTDGVSAQQLKLTLKALADFYRRCGGVGFEVVKVVPSDSDRIV